MRAYRLCSPALKNQADCFLPEALPAHRPHGDSRVPGCGFTHAVGGQERKILKAKLKQSKIKGVVVTMRKKNTYICIRSDQIRSVAQSCPTLCDPMNRSMPGLPVHHQLLEFTQTHVHRVSDAIQPSHPLASPSPPAPNPSQHQSLFQ